MAAAAPPMAAHDWRPNAAAFRAELDALREPLGIPGLAYAVVHDGELIAKDALGEFTTATPLRVASVTKALAALVVLQQLEAGTLSLDAPVKGFLSDFEGPADTRLRHLLSHASEGEPGTEYVYSSTRYARVGAVLQAATGKSFESLLRAGVLGPAGMRWYESPDLGTHAGLVSTVDEMAKLLEALDAGRVLRGRVLRRLSEPTRSTAGPALPVSLGWFAQDVQGRRITWSFGQDDPDHSGTLLVRVPAARWSLFVMANRNTLSDPFRLLMGDARKSPVATAFLRIFVASRPGRPLPGLRGKTSGELLSEVRRLEARGGYRYADELFGRALALLWAGEAVTAEEVLFAALDRYAVREAPDPVLHFVSARLGTPRSRAWGISQGERLLAAHPRNRWILFAQALLLAGEPSRAGEAARRYQAILDLPNQAPDFLRRLFRAWSLTGIAELVLETDPAQAERRLQEAIELKVGGGTEEQARRLLETLRGR